MGDLAEMQGRLFFLQSLFKAILCRFLLVKSFTFCVYFYIFVAISKTNPKK